MIPRAYITEWQAQAPWQTNEQVEQDLIICRSVAEIFSDPVLQANLAFRGGTALYKLHLPKIRYSEDIDLVQIEPGPMKPIFDALHERMSFLGTPKIRQKHRNNTLYYRYESEIPPQITMRLKIEICCREHISAFKLIKIPFQVASRWYSGTSDITTYQLEELLGSKLRALYQRKKGRDLFDIWYAMKHANVKPEKIIKAFVMYMDHVDGQVTQKQFIANMEAKITDKNFRHDITGLLRPNTPFDVDEAWQLVNNQLINLLK